MSLHTLICSLYDLTASHRREGSTNFGTALLPSVLTLFPAPNQPHPYHTYHNARHTRIYNPPSLLYRSSA